jgi:hypothetical protein
VHRGDRLHVPLNRTTGKDVSMTTPPSLPDEPEEEGARTGGNYYGFAG